MKQIPPALALTIWIVLTIATGARSETLGERIYFETCALCHGEDGAGAMPGIPDLNGPGSSLGKPNAVLLRSILEGIEREDLPTPMPPKGGNEDLTEEGARQVLDYMRRTFGN